ncbi:MAG: hypothetical protein V4679_12970 [Pseudomonadota bacterium]
MSFFANLLGGTLQGVGGGMSAMAADEEKLQAQRALLQEKQQERAADRQWQQEQTAARLAGGAGSGAGNGTGGSGRGFNLMEEAARAQTPGQRQDLINRVRAVDEDAGLRLADVGFGMPVMNAVAPTAGDFARYDRAGDMGAAPPTTTLERAAYDREKGSQALQRLYTLFLDPGKLDVHARGERQFGLNDRAGASALAVEQGGGSALDAAAAFQRGSAPQPERAHVRPMVDPTWLPAGPASGGGPGPGALVGTRASTSLARPLSSAPRDGTVVRDASGQLYVVRNGRPELQAKAR